jgi:hypothetical protein
MTMIPPKIKKLPKLRKVQSGDMKASKNPPQASAKGLYMGGAKMRNS